MRRRRAFSEGVRDCFGLEREKTAGTAERCARILVEVRVNFFWREERAWRDEMKSKGWEWVCILLVSPWVSIWKRSLSGSFWRVVLSAGGE